MSTRHLIRSPAVRAAALALAAAVVLLVQATMAAIRVDTAGDAVGRQAVASVEAPMRLDTTSDDLVTRAVIRDPFTFGRRSIAAAPRSASVAPAAERAAPLRLVGTVVDGASGDFALCQLGNDPPKVVRVGQSIGNYVLRRISQGAASFDSPSGGQMELRVSKQGS